MSRRYLNGFVRNTSDTFEWSAPVLFGLVTYSPAPRAEVDLLTRTITPSWMAVSRNRNVVRIAADRIADWVARGLIPKPRQFTVRLRRMPAAEKPREPVFDGFGRFVRTGIWVESRTVMVDERGQSYEYRYETASGGLGGEEMLEAQALGGPISDYRHPHGLGCPMWLAEGGDAQ